MYDYQNRMTVVQSMQAEREAEARRSHLLREAADARSARTERVQVSSRPGVVRRLRAALGSMGPAHATAHHAGAR